MANDNQPGQAPAHLSSQTVPAGNQTQANQVDARPEKQLLELQRREKEVRKMQESLKGAVPFETLKERAKSDRNNLLRELGLDDLITEDDKDPVVSLRKEMEALKAAAQKREQEEIDARSRNEFKSKLQEKKDEFELLMKLGYEDKAYELFKNMDSEAGEPKDPFSVAKQLEDAIFNDISALKDSKKFAGLFKPEPSQSNQRHPLDNNSTINSSDRTQTQQTERAPTTNRFQEIQDVSKHLKFT